MQAYRLLEDLDHLEVVCAFHKEGIALGVDRGDGVVIVLGEVDEAEFEEDAHIPGWA